MTRTLLLLGLLSSLGRPVAAQGRPAPADIVLLGGKVITVNARDDIAQAVAIRGQKIVAVGSDAEVRRYVGSGTRTIALQGRTVTPGLLDAHAHFAEGGADRLFTLDVSYPEAKSVADIAARVAGQTARLQPGDWILGRGWDEGKLAERRLVTARDLDGVAGGHPVWLAQTTGHYGVANSAALALAGITKETPNPPNGTIDRYSDGTPTGVLKESAQELVRHRIPARSPGQVDQGIRALAQEFNSEGMTGVKDPGIGTDAWDAYQRVLAGGGLTVRVFALWLGGTSEADARELIARRAAMSAPYRSTGDDRLISGGVKLFADGSGGARTAWLYDDWNKARTQVDSGNRGYPAFSPDTLRRMIRMYHDAGFHVSVHSIGDRTIDWVVDSYAQALRDNPASGRRHGIIHANIPTQHALDVMAELQRRYDAGYPEPSATFMWWIGDTYAANFGPARSLRLNPFRSYLARGIRWANGSDFDVTPFPARYGIWAAVARTTLLGLYGDPFGRDEAVDVHAALRAVTIWPARQMFLGEKIGSVEVGKYADLAVWDRDFYTVPTGQLKDARCQLTIFNGQVVFERTGAERAGTTTPG
ncbi:MAG TPA: amidohydrolase family protein [Gemmatimonadaceae bacterium]|nr:amidohydrolase family protein [Gemmatimonadaceae bacterium]